MAASYQERQDDDDVEVPRNSASRRRSISSESRDFTAGYDLFERGDEDKRDLASQYLQV